MSRPVETLDITLLRNNKNEFVIRCQRIISIIVKQYIYTGMFSAENFDDIKQNVNLELIKRLPLIEKNYSGEALMITYVSVVIKNICLRLYEKESSKVLPISLSDVHALSDKNSDNGILISEELERFDVALKLFHSLRPKILVCLKVYFSIPLSSIELRNCFPGITIEDHHHLLNVFETMPQPSDEFENFNFLTLMLNKYEQTSSTNDSIRRWTNLMLQKLITVMNGNPPTRAHTKDSLKVLLERYSELQTSND